MRLFQHRFQKLFAFPEWVLIHQAQKGNRDAFGKLYELYVEKIYRYIFFRVQQDKHTAEDITEIVFLRAWEKLHLLQTGSFQAWIYTLARHAIVDHFRKHKNTVELHEQIATDDEEEKIFRSLEMERVMECMKLLTQEQQEILTLKFINDLPNKEIAKILRKREDALRALQYRALQSLREKLQ